MALNTKGNLFRLLITASMMGINGVVINTIIVPNQINSGGISGIALILNHVAHIPIWLTTLILNIIIFAIGVKFLGLKFGLGSLINLLTLVASLYITESMLPIIKDPILAMISSAAAVGLSIGIVFGLGLSAGGTSTVVYILSNRCNKTAGFFDNVINGSILIIMIPFFQISKVVLSVGFLLISNIILNFSLKQFKTRIQKN